jgi:L-fucono-1,5-lactonase
MIVDAHQHFWDPARARYPWMTDDRLRRRFGPEDLEPLLHRHAVDATVVVQARQELNETRELLAIAAAKPWVLGVVGWVDLTGDVPRQLEEFHGRPLVGIRHVVEDEPDPKWLLREDVQRGLSGIAESRLVYDLLVRTPQLPAAVATVRRHPELRFVLDHVAKAPPDPTERAAWERGVGALAELPNVVCKLSGLLTEADPVGTAARALRWFGAERCMWGSDWPVCTLAGDYGDGLALVPADDRVRGGTAVAAYGLALAAR